MVDNLLAAARDRTVLAPLLRVWRTRALYALLTVVAIAGLPAYVAPLVIAYQNGGITPLLWVYLGIYIAFVSLALAPALGDRFRTMGLLALGYANGIASLARLGLAGSGRLYLIAMPLIAALLLGGRAGYAAAALSLLIFIAFPLLAATGRLDGAVTGGIAPIDPQSWTEAGLAFAVFLIVLTVLVDRFAELLARALSAQQKTSNDLSAAARALREREERLTRQNEMLGALHETALGIAGAHEIPDVFQALVERAVAMIGAAYGWLYIVDDDRDELVARVGTGFFQRRVGVRLARGEGLSGRIWELGKPLVVDNYRFWDGRAATFDGDQIGPALGVPLYLDGKVAGVVGLSRVTYSRPFTQDELDTMTRLSELAGITLANARLHTSLQQELAAKVEAQIALQAAYEDLERRVAERTRELATLNAVASASSRSLELHAVMSEALEKILQTTGSDMGLAYRLEPSSAEPDKRLLVLTAQRGMPSELLGILECVQLEGTVLKRAAAAGSPIVWHVSEHPTEHLREALASSGLVQGISVPLVARGELAGGIVLARRVEGPVGPDELALLRGIGAQVGVAIANARLYSLERERRAEAERSRRIADGLREIVAALNSGGSLDEMLDYIVKHACRMLNSDGAAIMRLEPPDDETGTLVVQAGCGLDAGFAPAAALPLNASAAGRALAMRKPVAVPDVNVWLAEAERRGDAPAYISRPETQSFLERFRAILISPLIVAGTPYGVIALYYRTPQPFTDEDVQQAHSLSDQAALAIQSARLRQQAGQAAAVEERNRLARELHDSVTQSLYSVTLYAEAAARQLEAGNSGEASAHLRELRDTSRDALREMRLLIYELRPPDLEKVGLAGALRARLQAVELRGGVRARLDVDGEEMLPLPVQQELYHIAREALNNALKHAQASDIRVRIVYSPGSTKLTITDDGLGFGLDAAAEAGGMGLRTMRERAARINAAITMQSVPGQGTTIDVVL